MAKGFALCVLLCTLLHGYEASVMKDERLLVRNQYAHLQAEIDEWKRLGKPTTAVFPGDGEGEGTTGLLTDLPKEGLLMKTDYVNNTQFYLYTRENPNGTHVEGDVESFKAAGWKASRPTKIIIHGFSNSIKSSMFSYLVPALLNNSDYNVVGVDWGSLARPPFYIGARNHVEGVGQVVAKLVDSLVNVGGLDLDDLHILGHSLGAHVSGNIGKHITTGKIARITGMDPAMPLFLILKSDRLNKTDAKMVDVVHTCGGLLGLEEAIGTVDFYPNGGSRPQPGCGVDLVGSCSHGRSYQFMAESGLEPNSFVASECSSAASATYGDCNGENNGKMGLDVEFDPNGTFTYFLQTASSFPFDLQIHLMMKGKQ